MIAVVNASTLVSRAQAQAMVDACARQVREHFAPAWSRMPSTPALSDGAPAAHVPTIYLVDDSDEPDALGYHTEASGGRVTGIVAVRPVLDAGGEMLTGPLSVSAVLSHEVLETHVDPWVDMWCADSSGRLWAFEVCDPVQGDAYQVNGVSVSDFVLPRFWDQRPPAGVYFDWMRVLDSPLSVAAGGYAVLRTADGGTETLGSKPAWRTGARMRHRLG